MREYLRTHIIKIFIGLFAFDIFSVLMVWYNHAHDNLAGGILMIYAPFLMVGSIIQAIFFLGTLLAFVPSNLIVDKKIRNWCKLYLAVTFAIILFLISEIPNTPL